MVIDNVLKESGVFSQPWYEYDWRTKSYFIEEYRDFFFTKKIVVEGFTFLLGSTFKGRKDTIIEVSTGAFVTDKNMMQIHSLKIDNDVDFVKYLDIKLGQSKFGSLAEVIANCWCRRAQKLDAWQISLMLS